MSDSQVIIDTLNTDDNNTLKILDDKARSENKDFSDFLLEEYEHISNAHFEILKQVSIFFRYYLIILSTPAIIIVFLKNDIEKISHLMNGQEIGISNYIGGFFLIISIIGLFLFIYIINLRHDGILYARAVNGIRKYFYDNKRHSDESSIRNLPTVINKPSYFEILFFPIILTFIITNLTYFYLSFKILNFSNYLIIFSLYS